MTENAVKGQEKLPDASNPTNSSQKQRKPCNRSENPDDLESSEAGVKVNTKVRGRGKVKDGTSSPMTSQSQRRPSNRGKRKRWSIHL